MTNAQLRHLLISSFQNLLQSEGLEGQQVSPTSDVSLIPYPCVLQDLNVGLPWPKCPHTLEESPGHCSNVVAGN